MTDDTKIALQNILQNLKIVYRAEFPDMDIKKVDESAKEQLKVFLCTIHFGKQLYQHRDELKAEVEKNIAEGKKFSPAEFAEKFSKFFENFKKLKETIKID